MFSYFKILKKHYLNNIFNSRLYSQVRKPKKYCKQNINNHKKILFDICKKENIKHPIYLTTSIIQDNNGGFLFQYYKSVNEIIKTIFPNEFKNHKRKPRFYWDNEINQKEYLIKLKNKLNIKNNKDWSTLSTQKFLKYGGHGILRKHGSLYNALQNLNILDNNYNLNNIFKNKNNQSIRFPRYYFTDKENRKQYIYAFAKHYNIHNHNDWIKKDIKFQDIRKYYGGNSILKFYIDLLDLLYDIYPEINWIELYDSKAKLFTSYWNKEREIQFIISLANKLGRNREQWHTISKKAIIENGGNIFLNKYKSISSALHILFKDNICESWKEKKTKRIRNIKSQKELIQNEIKKYNNIGTNEFPYYNINDQRSILINVQKLLNYSNINNFINYDIKEYKKLGLDCIFYHYYSLQSAFKQLYQEKDNEIYINNFSTEVIKKPNGYFKNIQNQHIWFNEILYTFFKSNNPIDLLSLRKQDIYNYGGERLLTEYSNKSLEDIYKTIYPDIPWKTYNKDNKTMVPRNYWQNIENQKKFIENYAKKHSITTVKDWINVKTRDFTKNGGSSIIKYYNNSFYTAIKTLNPHLNWDNEFIFKKKPKDYWKDKDNIIEFLKKLEDKYLIQEMNDWYRISRKQIIESGGSGLLNYHKTLLNILKYVYPDYKWDKYKIKLSGKRSQQRMLFVSLTKIIPSNVEIIEDFIHIQLNRKSSFSIEFDIFIPSMNIAFEYQGEHHYRDIPAIGDINLYRQRDEEKREICKENNITLIEIPYWISLYPENIYNYLKALENDEINKLLE